jgi:hypothetical protein
MSSSNLSGSDGSIQMIGQYVYRLHTTSSGDLKLRKLWFRLSLNVLQLLLIKLALTIYFSSLIVIFFDASVTKIDVATEAININKCC